MTLTPKNWKSFQHYKERTPSWIKLHKGLLTDFTFNRLPLASRALAPMLWLLASEYEDGEITASMEEIAFRLHVTEKDLSDAITPLVNSGFFVSSNPLASREQGACLERENIGKTEEETETEATASAAPVDPAIPEREYFIRGREVLGNKSGAMIANLLKAKGRNVALARAALEEASQKQKPLEYAAAICRGPPPGKPLTEFQRSQNEMKDILNELGNFARGGSGSGGQNLELLPDHSGGRSESLRGGPGEAVVDVPRSGYRASG